MKRFIVTEGCTNKPPDAEVGDIAVEVEGVEQDGYTTPAYKFYSWWGWRREGHDCNGLLTGAEAKAGWRITPEHNNGYELLPRFNVGDIVRVVKILNNKGAGVYANFGSQVRLGHEFKVTSVCSLTGRLSLTGSYSQTGIDPRQLMRISSLQPTFKPAVSLVPKKEMNAWEKGEAEAIKEEVLGTDESIDELMYQADDALGDLEANEEYRSRYDDEDEEEDEDYDDEYDEDEEEEEEEEFEDEMSIDEQIRQAEAAERKVTPKRSKPLEYTPTPVWGDYFVMDHTSLSKQTEDQPQFRAEQHQVRATYIPRKGRGLNFRSKKIF